LVFILLVYERLLDHVAFCESFSKQVQVA